MAKQKTATKHTAKPAAKAKKPVAKTKPKTAKSKPFCGRQPSAGRQTSAKKTKTPDSDNVHWIISQVTNMMNDFIERQNVNSTLTGIERQRLIGAGVRNYGFIEKAWDIARENPQFLPSNFTLSQFNANIQSLDDYRQLYWVLEKFLQAVNECMLISADASFRDALRIYNGLREQARGRVHGAEPLFMALLRFFRRRRPAEELESEPTMKELEKDFNRLIHGHADGEIVIKNEKPHLVGGKRTVVDDVHKGRASIKETAEAEIEE